MELRVGPHAAPTSVSQWVPMQLPPPTRYMVGPQGAPSTCDTGNPTAAPSTHCKMGPTTVPSTHGTADPLVSSSSRITVGPHAVPSIRSFHGWSPRTSLTRVTARTPHPLHPCHGMSFRSPSTGDMVDPPASPSTGGTAWSPCSPSTRDTVCAPTAPPPTAQCVSPQQIPPSLRVPGGPPPVTVGARAASPPVSRRVPL